MREGGLLLTQLLLGLVQEHGVLELVGDEQRGRVGVKKRKGRGSKEEKDHGVKRWEEQDQRK